MHFYGSPFFPDDRVTFTSPSLSSPRLWAKTNLIPSPSLPRLLTFCTWFSTMYTCSWWLYSSLLRLATVRRVQNGYIPAVWSFSHFWWDTWCLLRSGSQSLVSTLPLKILTVASRPCLGKKCSATLLYLSAQRTSCTLWPASCSWTRGTCSLGK